MPNTTKRTDRSRHYEHNGVTPPKSKKPATPEDDGRMLCPMSRKPCLHNRCMIWDSECDTCTLNPANLYCKIREAATDAVVEIITAYSVKEGNA